MKRLLIISKKSILCTHTGEVLIPYDGTEEDALREWVSSQFNVLVVKTQMIAQTDIIVLTVVEKQHTYGGYISISKAIELVGKENHALHDFLNNLRTELDIQLEYGVKDGKIICITDIPIEKKGLQCECVCPGCGGRLVVRKGAKKKHHFAHYNEPCNLIVAQQTALHMLAKEIIEQEKEFMFPGYTVSPNEVDWKPDHWTYVSYRPTELQYRKPYKSVCESVTLETKVSDLVPDIFVSVRGKKCLIEIAVTHFVDKEKQKKIEELGLPTVEVDLSSLHRQTLSRDTIKDVLVNQTAGKTWLYNPLREEAIAKAKRKWQKEYDAEVKKAEEAQREWKRQEEIREGERRWEEEKRKQKIEKATAMIDELWQPENYKKALLKLRSDKAFHEELCRLSFQRVNSGQIPFYLDIPISGEKVFDCDRRVWQAAIFDKFIYNQVGNDSWNIRNVTRLIDTIDRNRILAKPLKTRASGTLNVTGSLLLFVAVCIFVRSRDWK